jgi:GxxExxY protein
MQAKNSGDPVSDKMNIAVRKQELCGKLVSVHHRGTEDTAVDLNTITERIIGAAIEVNKLLGPGLMESAYDECLCRELALRCIGVEKQLPLPVEYKEVRLNCGYRLDFLVEQSVVVEIKSLSSIEPIHESSDLPKTGRLEALPGHQLQCAGIKGRHTSENSMTFSPLRVLCASVVNGSYFYATFEILRRGAGACNKRGYQANGTVIVRPSTISTPRVSSVKCTSLPHSAPLKSWGPPAHYCP